MPTELHIVKNVLAYKGQFDNTNGERHTVNAMGVTVQKENV
jgi:hypothetical protein